MKKILSLILAGLMTASCAAFVAADDAAAEATDAAVEEVAVDPAQAYAIEFLAKYGIFKGTSATEMVADADAAIQRYQMALFVSRISTGWVEDEKWEDGPANNSKFDDINDEPANKYLGALSYANQEGIIEGYSATKFAPYDGITYRDALTMVTRTLGYKGLSYPWGYIQQAVELGLTDGVDAAYTDNLTRGEVAVIIYNALFAEKKAGGTLAKSIFDVDFKWETIVIVSSDETSIAQNKVVLDRAPAGYVGFKIVDADGKLGATTYYVAEADMGLDAGHAAELAVGSAYIALFTADKDLVDMIDYDSLLIDTVVNDGLTNNAAETYTTFPILDALADYTLVEDKKGDEYISYFADELKVLQISEYEIIDIAEEQVGIDVANGNIMELDADGQWVVAWYYNSTLNRYYEFIDDDEDDGVTDVYINWMSDKEFNEWYADAVKKVLAKEYTYEFVSSFSGMGKDAYATLKLYDLDLDDDDLAEVASYKSYDFGYFYNSTATCGVNKNDVNHSGVAMPTYVIEDMDGNKAVNKFVEAGHEKHDPNYYSNIAAGEGFVWFNVDEEAVPGFKNADGSYNAGYVVYDWNKTTGEIEVVKFFSKSIEGVDEDSYVATGILQAYSTKAQTLTIDGESFVYGYDKALPEHNALTGVSAYMAKGDNSLAARMLSAYKLDGLLMQYVEVVVLDGYVVDIEAVGAANDEVIVVVDYAGITSDGYIAVYGYSTDSAKLDIFKINSYNGWKQGDYRYNPWNAEADEAFAFGTVYSINSYDSATNSYGVYTYVNPEDYVDNNSLSPIKLTFEGGYRVINDGEDVQAQAKTDSYILIQTTSNHSFTNQKTLPGFVNYFTGYDIPNGTEIEGTKLYASGGKFVIFVDTMPSIAGTYLNSDIGFVLYDAANTDVKKNLALEAAYDDAITDEWYLLGATYTTACALDLLTGEFVECIKGANIDLEDGQVYMTINGVMMGVVGENILDGVWDKLVANPNYNTDLDLAGFLNTMYYFYKMDGVMESISDLKEKAPYILVNATNSEGSVGSPVSDNFFAGAYLHQFDATAAAISKDALKIQIAKDLIDFTGVSAAEAKLAAKVVPTVKIVNLSTKNGDDYIASLDELAKGKVYQGYVLYNTASQYAIVYIVADETVSVTTPDKAVASTDRDDWFFMVEGTEANHVVADVVIDWSGKNIVSTDADKNETVTGAIVDKLYIGYVYTDECDGTHDNLYGTAECPRNGKAFTPDMSFFGDTGNNYVIGAPSYLSKNSPLCHEDLELVTWNTTVTDTKADAYWVKGGACNKGEGYDYATLDYVNVDGTNDKEFVQAIVADITDVTVKEDGDTIQVDFTYDDQNIVINMVWNDVAGAFEYEIYAGDTFALDGITKNN